MVTIDLAGHGESGLDRKTWTMPAFGADVVTVVRKLDLDQVVLVCHSMGGHVIAEAARRHTSSFHVVFMSDVGHFVVMEDPAMFNRLLAEIVEELVSYQAEAANR